MEKLLLSCLLFFIFSCKKDSEVRILTKNIVGTWEIQQFSGYPFTWPAYLPGNGQIIVIGKDGSFERRKHDTLVFRGNYP